MLPSMAETLEPLYSCKRGVLWRWWRNLISKVCKLLFTSTVLELLDTPLYYVIWPWRRILNGACISISNLPENIFWQTHKDDLGPEARGLGRSPHLPPSNAPFVWQSTVEEATADTIPVSKQFTERSNIWIGDEEKICTWSHNSSFKFHFH